MAIKPHSIDIVVSDMKRSLDFYRALGLPAKVYQDGDIQVEITTPGGANIGLVLEKIVLANNPHWVTPVGQRVTFSCLCDSPNDVDKTFKHMSAAGFVGLKEPWDALWGQRYAFLQDPDGNRVDIFAPLNRTE